MSTKVREYRVCLTNDHFPHGYAVDLDIRDREPYYSFRSIEDQVFFDLEVREVAGIVEDRFESGILL